VALALAAAGCAGSGGSGGGSAAVAIDPTSGPEALVALVDSAIAAAEPELARRALARATELAPSSATVHSATGRYYTAIYRYKDAKTEFEQAAALDPGSAEPHYGLGVAYLKAGSKEQAFRSLSEALKRDPTHARALAAIRPLLEDRYRAAGVPAEYASIAERSTVSRGELGVMLAVELGLDPDRTVWRADQTYRTDWPAIDSAWGSRWLRGSIARGWLSPLADGELHLDDPVTRGAVALLVARVHARSATTVRADSLGAGGTAGPAPAIAIPAAAEYADIGRRHYLARAAAVAGELGMPPRDGARFEPQAFVTGWECLRTLRGLARSMGAVPIVSAEPSE
jgi:hypothetical protein